MIERIVLTDPVTPNHLELRCECLNEVDCFRLFPYIEVYQVASKWADEQVKNGNHHRYYIVCQDCTNPRHGDIVAYVDYKGAILASVYAEKWETK